MFYFKGQCRPLELAQASAKALVMRVTHRPLLQPRLFPPACTPSGVGGGVGGCGEVVVDGGAHAGAVVLSVWHIKLYKGNHLCATPYY